MFIPISVLFCPNEGDVLYKVPDALAVVALHVTAMRLVAYMAIPRMTIGLEFEGCKLI